MQTQTAPSKLLRMKAITDLTGYSRAYIYILAKRGEFPQPIKLGIRASAWVESEVSDWIKGKIDATRVAA